MHDYLVARRILQEDLRRYESFLCMFRPILPPLRKKMARPLRGAL